MELEFVLSLADLFSDLLSEVASLMLFVCPCPCGSCCIGVNVVIIICRGPHQIGCCHRTS